MNTLLLILIAAAGGIAVTTQGQMMGVIDRTLGTKESVFITYVGGGLLAVLPILLSGGGNLAAWRRLPPCTLVTGVLGLVIVASIGYTVPRLGLSKALFIIVGTQLITAAVLEHFGFMGSVVDPFSWTKLTGILLMVAGVWFAFR